MKVLAAAIPGFGHTYPLMPLALTLIDAGHQVTFATAEPFLGRLPLPTVRGLPADVTIESTIAETRWRHPEAHGDELMVAMFGDTTAELVYETMFPVLQRERPDLVLYEAMNVGAGMAASVLDVPAVAFGIIAYHPAVPLIHAAAARFHAGRWSGRPRPADMTLLATAYLDPIPAALQDVPLAPRRIAVRPVAWTESFGDVPTWPAERADRPRVYLTLGTVSFGAVEVIRRAIDALAELDADVLVAVGPEGDPAALGDVPTSVRLERFVDQSRVLESVDLIVHHGGTGTLLGALERGLPQLILPQGADHFANGERLARAGAGRVLLKEDQVDGAIRDAVAEMLGHCPERVAAQRMREEITGMPTPARIVPTLERMVARSAHS